MSVADSVAQDMLVAFVRRIEALEDEIGALNSDKSEVYKEAKGNGFDVKVLRKIIADRRKDEAELSEFDAVYEMYAEALGMRLAHPADRPVRAHVEIIEEFDAETGEITEPQVAHQPASDLAEASTAHGQVASIPAAVEALRSSQETDVGCGGEAVQPEAEAPYVPRPFSISPLEPREAGGLKGFGFTVKFGREESQAKASEDGGTTVQAFEGPADSVTGDASRPDAGRSASATSERMDVTGGESAASNLATFTPRPLRPHCQRPERCGGQGRQHCYSCRIAAEQSGVA